MKPGGLHNVNADTYNGVDPLEMSCFRSMFNCITIWILMKCKFRRCITEVPKKLWPALLSRSLAGTTAFIGMTFALSFLPIAIFQTLFYTMPFFISILSYFILKEPFNKKEILAMIICFSGVILLINTK